MAKEKSARHHWWPKGVQDFWLNDQGKINKIQPDGGEKELTPKNIGVIGNGHYIKLSDKPNISSPFDQNFESEFQNADSNFPSVIRWMYSLERTECFNKPLRQRFLSQPAPTAQISTLIEGLISLAVRSPKNRQSAVSLSDHLMTNITVRERDALIGLNMRYSQRDAVRSCGIRGKIAVIFSPYREFIFGDGFFHNLASPAVPSSSLKLLAPLTPEIAVLYAIPSTFRPEPQLCTLVIDAEEAKILNDTVQIYSKDMIFYKTERPEIIDDFRLRRHLVYTRSNNPINNLIHNLPGAPDRDTTFDSLEQIYGY